jgi:hypothetical protein
MRLAFLIVAAVLALPAFGQWNRYASAGKGEGVTVAAPHPLAYFTREALVRDDNGQVGCDYCTAAEKAKILAEGEAEVSKAGTVGAYAIYDIFYSYGAPEMGHGRSILVKTAKDQYREILYIGNGDRYGKTLIVGNAPPNQMLWTSTGYGIMGMTVDHQLWIGDGMSVRLDLEAVEAADAATLKSAGAVREQPFNRQMPLPTFDSRGHELVYHCVAHDGSVEVGFTIDHGKAIVTGASYTPSQRP